MRPLVCIYGPGPTLCYSGTWSGPVFPVTTPGVYLVEWHTVTAGIPRVSGQTVRVP